MTEALKYDARYRETLALADGTPVLVRMVRPSDKAGLREGFLRLSPASRYRRFFSRKNDLSDAELQFLTEFDGINHFAIAAVRLDENGSEAEGIGVARFVRIEDDPAEAEFALAVTDDMQGKGVGRLLSQRLVEAAVERGVRWFRCTLLAENDRMRDLILELWSDAIFTDEGAMITARFALPEQEVAASGPLESLVDLLRHVATGAVVVPLALGLGGSAAWLAGAERAAHKRRADRER